MPAVLTSALDPAHAGVFHRAPHPARAPGALDPAHAGVFRRDRQDLAVDEPRPRARGCVLFGGPGHHPDQPGQVDSKKQFVESQDFQVAVTEAVIDNREAHNTMADYFFSDGPGIGAVIMVLADAFYEVVIDQQVEARLCAFSQKGIHCQGRFMSPRRQARRWLASFAAWGSVLALPRMKAVQRSSVVVASVR